MAGFGSRTTGKIITLSNVSSSAAQFAAITASVISASTYQGLPGGGGSTSPGGSDKQIQYNSGSSFAATSSLTYDYSTGTLSGTIAQFTRITGSTVTGSTAIFGTVTGSTLTGSTALIDVVTSTTITGSTVTGSTALFGTVTGSIVTGSTAKFGAITGSVISSSADIKVTTNIQVGGGSAVTKMKLYDVTFSGWTAVSGGQTSQQTGTLSAGSFTGITTSDTLFVNPTTHAQWTTSSFVILSVSASTDKVWFTWRNVSASAATPPTGSYKIFAITV